MLKRSQPERAPGFVPAAASAVALGALLLSGLLSGCSIPNAKPEFTTAKPADVGLSGAQAASAQVPLAGEWWHALGDPQLDRIMSDALAGSPTLETAMARLRLMQAGVDYMRAGLLPHVEGDAQESYQRLSENYIYPAPFAGSWRWLGSVQANLTWSLDLAGMQKALIATQREQANASALDIAAARVTLSGAVAQAYINLARAEQQSAIAAKFVASREQSERLAQTRKRSGLASDFDIRSAETLLAEARQAQVRADGAHLTMIHALAALAGRGVDYYSTIGATNIDLAKALPVPNVLPVDLLGRRADILAARARIDSANAARRYARAQFFPDVSISAFAGLQAIGLGNIVDSGSRAFGAGPAIHLPIFEGGALSAEYRGAVAFTDNEIASYNKLVVEAVQQCADALSEIATNAADAEQQRAIVHGLGDTVHLNEVRMRTGLGNSLDVLSSGDRLLQADQRATDIAADGAVSRVRLLVAIGGSFDPSSYPKTAAAEPQPAGKPAP
jgi:NodT family efflux transporter outer membrane factor (OMF) lipoprotein